MAEAYIGEIRFFSFGFPPKGWAFCNGQILGIAQNQALFSILGTTYGGNGTTNFALPNLQGRAPIHWGTGIELPPVTLGQIGGQETHALTGAETAPHNHMLNAAVTPAANTIGPNNGFLGASTQNQYAVGGSVAGQLAPETIPSPPGAGQPHNNMQPYLVINVCICISGIFPPHN